MSQERLKFETEDRLGRTVRLRESVYERHLPDRLEMADYLEDARRTIEDPDIELEDEDEGCYIYCRFGLGRDRWEKCFVKVFVYFNAQNVGEVATFFLPSRVGPEKVVWSKNPTSWNKS